MNQQVRNDAEIAGAGTLSAGTYGNVSIAGAGTVQGDIDCLELKIRGTSDVLGDVVATSVSIGGASSVSGSITCSGPVKVSGTSSVEGFVKADSLKVQGTASVGGAVTAQTVEIRGTSEIKGDVEAEVFDAQGAFSVGGLLNAGTITIRLYGGSDATDIGGETIDVRQVKQWAFLPFLGERNLTADAIEGDTVYLEHTRAKVVRGTKVTIGPGCRIDLVEYSESLEGTEGVRSNRRVEQRA